jgi:lipopolysaccharide/colanic/teichoic acid biosynthesis glycosyltransferase
MSLSNTASISSTDRQRSSKQIKYALDRLVAAVALLLLLPLFLLSAIAVFLFLGKPILFTQTRAGADGKIFQIYKFRSMTDARDERGNLLPDEQRLPVFGKFLRRVKIDELPQLWNVFKGDLSFVGPRPTLPEQVEKYDNFQKRRLSVTPGISGWAQVNGNIQLTWAERIYLDVWYIDHWSLWLDFLILIKTFGVIIGGERPTEKALEEAKIHANNSCRSC